MKALASCTSTKSLRARVIFLNQRTITRASGRAWLLKKHVAGRTAAPPQVRHQSRDCTPFKKTFLVTGHKSALAKVGKRRPLQVRSVCSAQRGDETGKGVFICQMLFRKFVLMILRPDTQGKNFRRKIQMHRNPEIQAAEVSTNAILQVSNRRSVGTCVNRVTSCAPLPAPTGPPALPTAACGLLFQPLKQLVKQSRP
jgi:hypothetical protein